MELEHQIFHVYGQLHTDVQLLFNGQCFPLFWYQKNSFEENTLFKDDTDKKEFNIDNQTIEDLKKRYKLKKISHEEIFYYIYGILHNNDYKNLYSNNLSKSLPRIPFVNSYKIFQDISKAGLELSNLHSL